MTHLLQANQISFSRGARLLFRDLALTINAGDRIGLTGHNGSGKSSLLALLGGESEPDSGAVTRANCLRLQTVEQFIQEDLLELTLSEALAERLPADARQSEHYRVEKLLADLGFADREADFAVRDLSGGQHNRLMFARALICEPDLILFDEPTNHLDLATLQVFEKSLVGLKAAFLLVSHDRAFLDAVTRSTLFLRDQQLHHFRLPYSRARKKLEELDTAAEARRRQEEKQLAKLKVSAKRLAVWGKVYDNEKLAKKARNMEKRIDRMEEEKTPVTAGSGLKLSLELSSLRANRILLIENEEVRAPDGSLLFRIEKLMLRPGDRVALLGANGAGKTTLISRILQSWQAGETDAFATFNPRCTLGFYDQELQMLRPSLTLTEILHRHCPRESEYSCRAGLISAGFPYAEHNKEVRQLSGGEKARIMFLIIRLNQPALLILDEPTNHIDIQGREELEAQLLETGASLLITSHDRHFIEQVANRFVTIQKGELLELPSPLAFYASAPSPPHPTGRTEAAIPARVRSEDDLLARIIELEQLLSSDLARRQKFQKPKRQAAWREELAELNRQLDIQP